MEFISFQTHATRLESALQVRRHCICIENRDYSLSKVIRAFFIPHLNLWYVNIMCLLVNLIFEANDVTFYHYTNDVGRELHKYDKCI